MGHREKLVGGEEYDMFTGWRKVIHSDKGRSHSCKKRFARRMRRAVKYSNKLVQEGYEGF